MARYTPRQQAARKLLLGYIRHKKYSTYRRNKRQKVSRLRRREQNRRNGARRRANREETSSSELSSSFSSMSLDSEEPRHIEFDHPTSDSETSSSSTDSSGSTLDSSSNDHGIEMGLLEVHLEGSSSSETDFSSDESRSSSSGTDSTMSELHERDDFDFDINNPEQPEEVDEDERAPEREFSGEDGDDEAEGDTDSELLGGDNEGDFEFRRWRYSRYVAQNYRRLYSHRYLQPHQRRKERGPARLPFILSYVKENDPAEFRSALRVTPNTFDRLVSEIEDDPVFLNNSQNEQIPVAHQLAVVLFRFGHSGNAASLKRVAEWAGYGKGTVLLMTRRVLTALLRPEFLKRAVPPPTESEREEAKQWVEEHSCYAWRNGWLFVDGTLIPLYYRPFWYAEAYFDRKCNYSLNIQVHICV